MRYDSRIRPRIRVGEVLNDTNIRKAVTQWMGYQVDYSKLYDYYVGRQNSDESERNVTSNHCHYITSAIRGYMTGNAPAYAYADGDTFAETIVEEWKSSSIETVESELIQSLSIYGVAYELVYRTDRGRIRSEVYPPTSAFVAYSGDIDADSVFGAIFYTLEDEQGNNYCRLYAYTREDVQVWESRSREGPWRMTEEPIPHGFGRVPLIEYANNADRLGDFEQVISLQDEYNTLLRDRVEDKSAFVSAILGITGQVIGKTPDEVEGSTKVINKTRVMQFDEGGSASFITKTLDEASVQTLQDCIKRDIHKLAMVPDLSDEAFANNASGVAMSYKLFGTDNKVSDKERYFREGFLRRCKLYDHALFNASLSPTYEPTANISDMRIVFKLNAPQDLSYMATSLTPLISAGVVSRRTAMENLLLISDADQEQERIDRERTEDAEYNRATFESDTFPGMVDEADSAE